MKKLLTLLFSLFLLVSPSVFAETVLFCQSELATGFIKKNGSWKEMNFMLDRYTVKFNNDYSRLEGLTYNPMECKVPYSVRPELIFCVHSVGSHETFIYDKKKTRFSFSNVSAGGYAFDGEDTEVLLVGNCKEF